MRFIKRLIFFHSGVISFEQLVPEDHFAMDPSDGLIAVAKTVDAYTEYVLYVYAEDNGSPRLKSRSADR